MTQVSVDTAAGALASSRRRYGRSIRRQRDDPVAILRLAAVGAAGSGDGPDDVPASERTRCSVSLYQRQLPKHEAAELTTYEAATGTGSGAGVATDIDSTVALALCWRRVTGAVFAVTVSLFVGRVFGASVLTALSPMVLLVAVVLAVLSLTAIQFTDDRHCRNARLPELTQR